jgi:hypothetical protein
MMDTTVAGGVGEAQQSQNAMSLGISSVSPLCPVHLQWVPMYGRKMRIAMPYCACRFGPNETLVQGQCSLVPMP